MEGLHRFYRKRKIVEDPFFDLFTECIPDAFFKPYFNSADHISFRFTITDPGKDFVDVAL